MNMAAKLFYLLMIVGLLALTGCNSSIDSDTEIVVPSTNTVTFHYGGGTILTEKVQAATGQPFGPENIPVVENTDKLDFKGWYTPSNDEFTADTVIYYDMDIYGHWTAQLTFDTGGGTPEEPLVVPYGGTAVLPVPEKAPYTFVGWRDGEANYCDNATPIMEHMELFAVWGYTVSFDAGDCDCNTELAVEDNKTIPDEEMPEPSKDGYVFMGWNSEPDGSGSTLTDTTQIDEDKTYYAQWGHSVTLNYMYEEEPEKLLVYSTNILHGKPVTGAPSPNWQGHQFLEWNTASDGSGATFDLDTDPVENNLVLYALWSASVTFINGSDITRIAVRTGERIPNLPAATPPSSPAGMELVEWNTQADGDGDSFDTGTVVESDMTVYAIWGFRVTFAFEAGIDAHVSPAYRIVQNGKPIGPLPVPTSIGNYRFKGWKTDSDPTTATGYINETYIVNRIQTLYGIWYGTEENPIQIGDSDNLTTVCMAPDLHYILIDDIDLGKTHSAGWSPLCSDTVPFTGVFNGNGYRILNLYLNHQAPYAGLFAAIEGDPDLETGKVHNLGITVAIRNGDLSSPGIQGQNYVGAIAGYIKEGIIENCSVSFGIIAGDDYVGGLVGQADNTTFTNIYTTSDVQGNRYVGGIAGETTDTTASADPASVRYGYTTGSIYAKTNRAGGMAGGMAEIDIEGFAAINKSVNSNSNAFTGRFIGDNNSTATVPTGPLYAWHRMQAVSSDDNPVGKNQPMEKFEDPDTYESDLLWGLMDGTENWVMPPDGGLPVLQRDSSQTPEPTYTVHFIYGDISLALVHEYLYGEEIISFPDLPIFSAGESFVEWNTSPDGRQKVTDSTPVYKDMIVYAITDNTGESEDKPKLIYTAEELAAVGDTDNLSKHYKLMTDIDLNGVTWTPIGTGTQPFTGSFDGGYHTLKNLTVTTGHQGGLFGTIDGTAAFVKNLIIDKASVETTDTAGIITGVLIDGTIDNCTVTEGMAKSGTIVGGIVGQLDAGTVKNSMADVEVQTTSNAIAGAGGIAGTMVNGSLISTSCSTGQISGREGIGGIAGSMDASVITDSYSTAEVTSSWMSAGGIAGKLSNSSQITRSYSEGQIRSSDNMVGGIAGSGEDFTIVATMANNVSINITSSVNSDAHRIIGYTSGSTILSTNIGFAGLYPNSATPASNPSGTDGEDKTLMDLELKDTYKTGLTWNFGTDEANPWMIDEGGGRPYLYYMINP